MKKTITIAVLLIAILVGGAWYWMSRGPAAPTFLIEGQPIQLADGRAETDAAPGAASKTVTQYFGNVATGDLSGDGAPDIAFLLTQSRGGSGTFYYVVATLVAADGSYQGTNAVLLGDRVAPQTTEIRDGVLIVNYAERRPNEPMTTQPSLGVSKYLRVEGTTLVEVPPPALD